MGWATKLRSEDTPLVLESEADAVFVVGATSPLYYKTILFTEDGSTAAPLGSRRLRSRVVLNLNSARRKAEYEDCYPCRYTGLGRRFRSGANWPEGKVFMLAAGFVG
ncbi:hypothetical protein THAOC_07035 [Thalassiosira oceanica]|uniref:Uncharacterized protein n=1 Tax=Thalassiosira oceanica TaxID=159749 RepID=K0TDD8_THAOC|nr:hypothetical protein THAOC_07035 [Thalassiosira oceanica]|eukprot:EJK71516.1 hypothetical protein THAOC_07035 [Thalassiosira oceanica]